MRIDKMVDKWAGSIEIGVTTHNPAYLQLPSTMTNLRSGEPHDVQGLYRVPKKQLLQGYGLFLVPHSSSSAATAVPTGTWMMTGNGVMHNGTTILDEYGHNLDRLKVREQSY